MLSGVNKGTPEREPVRRRDALRARLRDWPCLIGQHYMVLTYIADGKGYREICEHCGELNGSR
jgi:hypothetical protein